MRDTIKYKDFIATIRFNAEDEVFHGKLEGVNDLITFESETVAKLKLAMKEAVEDYLEICVSIGKDPRKSFKGTFNVRIKPQLHERASLKSVEEGVSLNQIVEKAIEGYLTT